MRAASFSLGTVLPTLSLLTGAWLFAACGGDDFNATAAPGSGGSAGATSAGGSAGSTVGGSGSGSGSGGSQTVPEGKSCETSAECEDGDRCKGTALCSANRCIFVSPPVLDDANACTTDTCEPSTGSVSHTPVPLGDGDPCTKDTCDPTSGVGHTAIADCGGCATNEDCDDGNPCTDDVCDSAKKCTSAASSSGAICKKGNECRADKTCNDEGQCVGGGANPLPPVNACQTVKCDDEKGKFVVEPKNVDDGDPCTADSCDEAKGPQNRSLVDDGDACTQDSCDATQGAVHTTIPVSDGDPCTIDGCASDKGVFHEPIPMCTGCKTDADCQDKNPCTVETCDSSKGTCSVTDAPASTTCSDGVFCNGLEVCKGSTCSAGSPPVVDDGDACTVDTCVELAGKVVHEAFDGENCCATDAYCASHLPGTGANDPVCRAPSQCNMQKHQCVQQPETTRVDTSDCTLDLCNPATGTVTHPPDPTAKGCCDPVVGCPGGIDPSSVTPYCRPAGTCSATTGQCVYQPGDKNEDPDPCSAYRCDPVTGHWTEYPCCNNDKGANCEKCKGQTPPLFCPGAI
jgi:hypothetical protein